ncbi:hypothetical protein J6V85_02180 [Candidatus Saccharibacteria bacterium]|nr:hypothetical protein [Candidatus Saccharibacteria bacterium]
MSISRTEVAMAMPEWVAQIKDRKVLISVFALIIFHIMGRLPFNGNSLKQEIDEFDDLSEKQKKEVFDLIVSHKD